jgi:hypothetical protein
MVNTTIYIDESEVKRRLGVLESQSGKVIARAANRAYVTGRSAIAKEAGKDYLVTRNDVNNSKVLKITKATASKPTAVLDYKGQHRNLYLWNNKKAVTPNKVIHWSHGEPNVKVYKAAVRRGHGRTELTGENKPFIQSVRGGSFTGLFRRQYRQYTARREKLVGIGAPAIPQIVKNDRVMAHFRNSAGPMLQKRLEHEIKRVLEGGSP